MTFNREQLAWAAGLFEGEGCFSFNSRSRSISACLVNTDQDTVEAFNKAIGFGRVLGPYITKGRDHWKPKYKWVCSSFENTQALIVILWPWLGSRRRSKAIEVLTGYMSGVPTSFYETQKRTAAIKARLLEIADMPRGNRWTLGPTHTSIAKEFGVSDSRVNQIMKEMVG